MESLLSWQTLFISVSIFVVTWFIRRLAQTLLPLLDRGQAASTSSHVWLKSLWEGFLLPAMPIIVGATLCGLFTSIPYPAGITTKATRVLWGTVCGFFSGWGYHVAKSIISTKFNVKLEGDPNSLPGTTSDVKVEEKKEVKDGKA